MVQIPRGSGWLVAGILSALGIVSIGNYYGAKNSQGVVLGDAADDNVVRITVEADEAADRQLIIGAMGGTKYAVVSDTDGGIPDGLGTMSTQNANAVAITGGSVTGITDLAVADGGTGSSTADAARTALAAAGTGTTNTFTDSQTIDPGNLTLSNGNLNVTGNEWLNGELYIGSGTPGTDAVNALKVSASSLASYAAANDTAANSAYMRTQKGGTATSGNGRAGGTLTVTAGAGSDAFAAGGGNGGAGGSFTFNLGAGGAKDGGGTDGASGNFNVYAPTISGSQAVSKLSLFDAGSTTTGTRLRNEFGGGYVEWFGSSSFLNIGVNSTIPLTVRSDSGIQTSSSFEVNTGYLRANSADFSVGVSDLTSGTMTQTKRAAVRRVWHRYSWTNAMIVALGASPTGDITVCTLPAKVVVTRAFIVVTTAATFGDTLTMSLGDTGANYDDYVLDGDIKAAANTVYGDSNTGSETGTNLFSTFFIDRLPSFTGTTAVKVHVDGNATNLSGVTTSTGEVYLETYTLP